MSAHQLHTSKKESLGLTTKLREFPNQRVLQFGAYMFLPLDNNRQSKWRKVLDLKIKGRQWGVR